LGLIWVLHNPTEAKITQLCHSLFEENVGGFDIPVDDAEFEKCQISLREMPHEGLSLGLAQPLILPILLEIVLEIAVLAVLQHHVDVLSRSEIIIQFDDKW
jgi:hypothetical protein